MKDVTNFKTNKLDLFSLTPAQRKLVIRYGEAKYMRPRDAVFHINAYLSQLDWQIRLRPIMGKVRVSTRIGGLL